jgi:hypothetical protein
MRCNASDADNVNADLLAFAETWQALSRWRHTLRLGTTS